MAWRGDVLHTTATSHDQVSRPLESVASAAGVLPSSSDRIQAACTSKGLKTAGCWPIPTACGAEFLVNSYTTGPQDEAAVASDSAGDFVGRWEGAGGGGYGIYAAAIQRRGRRPGKPVRSEFERSRWETRLPRWRWIRPAISLLLWAATPMADGYGIFAQRYNCRWRNPRKPVPGQHLHHREPG